MSLLSSLWAGGWLRNVDHALALSMRHARDVIVKLPQFPDEAPTSTPRNRLWLRSDF